jgi:cytochrome c553
VRRATFPWGRLALAAALVPCCILAAPAPKAAAPKTSAGPPCDACHGAHGEGMAAAHVPRLTGQSAEYLQKQLDDYASGARDNPVMSNFAKSLSEEQRSQLATHYAGMTAAYLPETGVAPTASQLARGHQLAYQGDERRQVQSCNSCHGPDGSGVLHAAPYLAGQSSEYLASAIKSFQAEARKNDAGQLMRSVAKRLNDDDIAAVSAYFAQTGTAHLVPSSAPKGSP